jgi:hypothetical protein
MKIILRRTNNNFFHVIAPKKDPLKYWSDVLFVNIRGWGSVNSRCIHCYFQLNYSSDNLNSATCFPQKVNKIFNTVCEMQKRKTHSSERNFSRAGQQASPETWG